MEQEQHIYRPLDKYNLEDAINCMRNGSLEELAILPLSVGQNLDDWKAAQNICVALLSHDSALVRANAALGLAYIARTKGKLDKRIVKPYFLKELRENKAYRRRIIDAINDINLFLKWRLGEKTLKKMQEEKFEE